MKTRFFAYVVLLAFIFYPAIIFSETEKITTKIKLSQENQINVTYEIAKPNHRAARYTTLKKLRMSDYLDWKMNKGSRFGEKGSEFNQPENTEMLEILLIFENNGSKKQKVELKNVRIEDKGNTILPWEFMPGNVYGDYDYLAQRLRLSTEPPSGSFFIQLDSEGELYCDLNVGEKTWAAFMFFVPKNLRIAKLTFDMPQQMDINIQLK